MKRIAGILFIYLLNLSLYSQNYYVSSSTGNDNNDGLTESTPWQTLSKVSSSTFAAGDIIAFKSGDTWREELTIPSGGESGNPITFSSYGTGYKPRILGSEIETSWTLESGNIWKSASTYIEPSVVSGWGANTYFVETNGDVTWGRVMKANTGACVAEYDWTWTTDNIYIYSPTDPNTRYSGVEISQRRASIKTDSQQYITIDGIETAYGASFGIGFGYEWGKLFGFTVTNCHIHHIGIKNSGEAYGIESFYSDALFNRNEIHDCGRRAISLNMYQASTGGGASIMEDVIVEDNEFYNGFHTTGVDIAESGGGTINNITVRRNTTREQELTAVEDGVENYGSTLLYVGRTSTGSVNNINIYSNIFIDHPAQNINLQGIMTVNIYNNTFYGVSEYVKDWAAMIVAANGAIADIKNNLFYNNNNPATNNTVSLININGTAGVVTLDNNLYYNTLATRFMVWYDTDYSVSQWEEYKTASSQDANSLIQNDPLLVSSTDYHLQDTSPAINAGVDVGLTADFYGNTVPYLSTNPDIGIFESNINEDGESGSITASAGSDVSICNRESTTLTASGGVTYLWNTGATTESITVSPTSTETYTVTAVDGNGNTDSDDVIVTVNNVIANAGANVTINEGESTTLSASGGGNYSWSNGATTQSITVSPTATKTYTVTATKNGCQDTDKVKVTVNQTTGSVKANAGVDAAICSGESTTLNASGGSTYLWSTGSTTASITVSPTSTQTYTLTATDGNGNTDSDDVIVTVNNVTANAGANVTISEGESATLTASGGDTYSWSNGVTTQSITVSPTATKTYTVTATKNGCQDTDKVKVTVNQTTGSVKANAGVDAAICSGESTTLNASGGSTYLWNTGATTASIAVSPSSSKTYTVTATDASGNTDSDDVIITVENCKNEISEDEKDLAILEMNLYPNPTTGDFNIRINNLNQDSNLIINDAKGALIHAEQIKSQVDEIYRNLHFTSFTGGVYFIRLFNSKESMVRKLVLL